MHASGGAANVAFNLGSNVGYHDVIDAEFMRTLFDERLLTVRGHGWITRAGIDQATGEVFRSRRPRRVDSSGMAPDPEQKAPRPQGRKTMPSVVGLWMSSAVTRIPPKAAKRRPGITQRRYLGDSLVVDTSRTATAPAARQVLRSSLVFLERPSGSECG